MSTKVVPGQLVASRDVGEVAREAATRIARVLRTSIARNGRVALALSGGNTPRDAYGLLARESGLDWTKVDVFQVDERAVPPTNPRSNWAMLDAALLKPTGIAPGRTHRMRAEETDRDAVARDYQRIIETRVEVDADGIASIDVVVLGVGEDGHTASLFPRDPVVDVTDRLVASVAAKGDREARITLTSPALEHARQIFLIAVGSAKRDALERVWATQGDVHETPARVVRGCRGAVTWLIDKAAGGLD
jgi:6-phosphogluconolactonase